MLMKAKRDGGTAFCWQFSLNDPSKEKDELRISLLLPGYG
jgi:hypothetical protein